MKRFQAKRDAAALNSRLVRRPIQRMVWLFLLPTFAAFCIGFIYPFLKGAFLSFCKFKLTSKWTWVGFDNYLKAFADSSFRHAFLFTALFAFVSVLFINALAFAVAYALTRGIKGSNLFRTVFFMPNLIGGIVLGFARINRNKPAFFQPNGIRPAAADEFHAVTAARQRRAGLQHLHRRKIDILRAVQPDHQIDGVKMHLILPLFIRFGVILFVPHLEGKPLRIARPIARFQLLRIGNNPFVQPDSFH